MRNPVPETKEEFGSCGRKTADAAPEGMRRLRTGRLVYSSDFRETGLENVPKRSVLKDQNHDFLPDALDVNWCFRGRKRCYVSA